MGLSEREKTAFIQANPMFLFKVDQKVRLKKEHERMNGGQVIQGYVNSIRLDRNGVWYEVLYHNGETFKSVDLMDCFLESI